VYGSAARGLQGFEAGVQRDAWSYADGLEGVTSAERQDAARTFAATEAAYVYGLPLVKLHDTVRNFRFRNAIVSVAALANPDTDGRFYTFQFMDGYTNSFAYVGTGATGTSAGSFVLGPPGWNGDRPEGTQILRSPTNTV
jgi:hypothetical protein